MTTGRIGSTIRMLGFALIGLMAGASPLATRPAHAYAIPGVLADAAADSLLILLPPRAAEAIQQDRADSEALESAANANMVFAQGRLGEVRAHVEVRKSDIESTKSKIKLAKEQKNKTEQADLERQVKAQELQLKVLEARRDMREAEVSLADARRKAGQVQAGFFKQELELLGKRGNLQQMGSVPAGAANLDGLIRIQGEIRDLEQRCMEILKDVALNHRKVAEAEVSLLDKRLKLHELQLELLKGPEK